MAGGAGHLAFASSFERQALGLTEPQQIVAVLGLGSLGNNSAAAGPADHLPRTAPGDVAVTELRELAERHADREAPDGAVTVRWSYEILAPLAIGALGLLVLWLV